MASEAPEMASEDVSEAIFQFYDFNLLDEPSFQAYDLVTRMAIDFAAAIAPLVKRIRCCLFWTDPSRYFRKWPHHFGGLYADIIVGQPTAALP